MVSPARPVPPRCDGASGIPVRTLKSLRLWCAGPPCRARAVIMAAMNTPPPASRDPLHGLTLEALLVELVSHFGWAELGQRIRIRCFTSDPSIASSLKFLRKTPWAREKVEGLYLFMLRERARRTRA